MPLDLEMDSESCYSTQTGTTNPSLENEPFSIESLIQRVDEFQKRDHLQSLEILARENNHLRSQILQYQREWCSLIDLLRKARESLLVMQRALGVCFKEQVVAERDWLAFWRGHAKHDNDEAYSPAGWI